MKGGGVLLRVISGISRGEHSLLALWIEPQCNASSVAILSAVAPLSLPTGSRRYVKSRPKQPRRCSHLILKMSNQRGEGRVWGLPGPGPSVISPS